MLLHDSVLVAQAATEEDDLPECVEGLFWSSGSAFFLHANICKYMLI